MIQPRASGLEQVRLVLAGQVGQLDGGTEAIQHGLVLYLSTDVPTRRIALQLGVVRRNHTEPLMRSDRLLIG